MKKIIFPISIVLIYFIVCILSDANEQISVEEIEIRDLSHNIAIETDTSIKNWTSKGFQISEKEYDSDWVTISFIKPLHSFPFSGQVKVIVNFQRQLINGQGVIEDTYEWHMNGSMKKKLSAHILLRPIAAFCSNPLDVQN